MAWEGRKEVYSHVLTPGPCSHGKEGEVRVGRRGGASCHPFHWASAFQPGQEEFPLIWTRLYSVSGQDVDGDQSLSSFFMHLPARL